jgi:hypothetical protein
MASINMKRNGLFLPICAAAIIIAVAASPGLGTTPLLSGTGSANDELRATRGAGTAPAGSRVPIPESSFLPVAVWYGGGKVRAPMLERVDASSAEGWGKDLDAIKKVGFNTVKCWVDWATAEPRPDDFNFENLDLLLRLAQERGLRVIVQA